MFFAVEPLWGPSKLLAISDQKLHQPKRLISSNAPRNLSEPLTTEFSKCSPKLGNTAVPSSILNKARGWFQPPISLIMRKFEMRALVTNPSSVSETRLESGLRGNRDNPRLRINIYYIGKDCGKILAEREDTLISTLPRAPSRVPAVLICKKIDISANLQKPNGVFY